MARYKEQADDLIFALDIGTRSIVGIVGKPVGEKLQVLDVELAEHGRRAMMDGQIDDIQRVADLARAVTNHLQERQGVRLRRVCVAAAGRALRTQRATFATELPSEQVINADQISRLETGAVSAAEEALQVEGESRRQLFLVGYTVAQYRLDNYPMANLLDHTGRRLEADVVATFLPGEVVESLYAAMRAAGLQVASMTLEPIAAMNAAIPADLRLLNLALVDIGAGTTDIALCKDGSVIGYTMATVAGDEITEAIMRAFLVDFQTAERIKRGLGETGDIQYKNVLGMEETTSSEAVTAAISEPMENLAKAIAQQVVEVNGGTPSAVFLAGGGSKLIGLREKVAESLHMDDKRVAIAGNNFSMSAFSETLELENPEYATPLGIAVSAGLGLLNDSYVVTLNGQPAKLFRNGVLTLRDILLMNGYVYADMLGKTGKSLCVTLNGKRTAFRGDPAVPATLRVNGTDAPLAYIVHAGDQIQFIPAKNGADARRTLGQLLGEGFHGRVLVNEREVPLDTPLRQEDVILTSARRSSGGEKNLEKTPRESTRKNAAAPTLHVTLNQSPLELAPKESGMPYLLMDLLQYSGLDAEHLDNTVKLEVNGMERGFQYELKDNDTVTICCA